MNRTEAMIAAKANLKTYLNDRGWTKGGECPVCGHRDCFNLYDFDRRWSCFSAQHEGIKEGDIFDLHAALTGRTDGKAGEVIREVYEALGFIVEESKADREERLAIAKMKEDMEARKKIEDAKKAAEAEERRKFIEEAQKAIETPEAKEYLERRGISVETAKDYGLGFCSAWRSPAAIRKGKTPPASPRLIIPNDEGGYLARDTRKVLPSEADRYAKQKEGNSSTLGLTRLSEYDALPVFVVEGELDALSIIEAGGAAVALGSVANVEKLVGGLSLIRTEAPKFSPQLVLALDRDEAGDKASTKLSSLLASAGFTFRTADTLALYGKGNKDANAALVADREGFSARVHSFLSATEEELAEARRLTDEEYRKANSAQAFASAFSASLDTERKTISSGFPSLDQAISGWKNGGLPVGLYVIGGISSIGKTTLTLQIADQMAEAGHDILIFSLEMSRLELIGKSISRRTVQKCLKMVTEGGKKAKPYTWADIRDMAKKTAHGVMTAEDRAEIDAAAAEYFSSIGSRVFIVEGSLEGTTIEKIKAKVAEHKAKTGRAPVVFVDYLQMIAAPEGMATATDKALTDYKVRACKVLSRDFDTPVIVISSLNRESYFRPMELTSFKESGSIEYTADCVLGLQYPKIEQIKEGKSDDAGRTVVSEARNEDTREVEVKILKNRSGGMIDRPLFSFYAKFNAFVEKERDAKK